MNKEQLNSFKKVLDYLEYDEHKHYEECEPRDRKDHIYRDVKILKKVIK